MHNFSDKISVHFAMFKIKVGLSFKNLQIDILVIEKKLPHSACMDHAPFRHDETKQKKPFGGHTLSKNKTNLPEKLGPSIGKRNFLLHSR